MFYLRFDHPSKCIIFPLLLLRICSLIHSFLQRRDISYKFWWIKSHNSRHSTKTGGISCTMLINYEREWFFHHDFQIYSSLKVYIRFRWMSPTWCQESIRFNLKLAFYTLKGWFFIHKEFQKFHKFDRCYNKLHALCFGWDAWF